MKLTVNNKTYEVKSIQIDSRKITPGDLFIAYKGVSSDGHDYIKQAIENGASLVVGEREISELPVPYHKVENGRAFWSNACAEQYDHPEKKLKLIGITGTDGKTTTSNFIYQILKSAGYKVALLSTVNAKFCDITLDTGLHTTTPDPDVLYKILRDLVDAGAKYLVLEVTSHAIALQKIYGLGFEVSGLTNITPEHLDFHKTFDEYVKTKCKLFDQSKIAVINSHSKISNKVKDYTHCELFYSKYDDDLIEKLVEKFSNRYPGKYNFENAALAIEISEQLGVTYDQAVEALNNCEVPTGRFEMIKNQLGINIVVDFAHTENAMREVLSAVRLKRSSGQKIITVFGCAGERDFLKRPRMGSTSAELSDVVILTSEDPRNEDINQIMKEITSETSGFDFKIIIDRKEAIKTAIQTANKGDWVLILGKGHEKSMNIKGIEYEWNDIDVINKILTTEFKEGQTF